MLGCPPTLKVKPLLIQPRYLEISCEDSLDEGHLQMLGFLLPLELKLSLLLQSYFVDSLSEGHFQLLGLPLPL